MYYRILGGKLIQISDNYLEGYKEIIEDEKPKEKDGFYIAFNYAIINNEVHKTYHYEEIKEEESLTE